MRCYISRCILPIFFVGAVASWHGNFAARSSDSLAMADECGADAASSGFLVEECGAPNLLQLKHEVAAQRVGAGVRSSAVGSKSGSTGAESPAIAPFREISSNEKFCRIADVVPYWRVLGGDLEVAIACEEPSVCEEFQAVAESSCGRSLQKTFCAEKIAGTFVGLMKTDGAEDCSYVSEGKKSLDDYKQLPGNFCEQTTSQSGCEDACSTSPHCAGYAFMARTSHCVLSMSDACPAGLQELELLQNAVSRQTSDCVPYSAESCRQAATAAGLEFGGGGYDFEGDYSTKGCYAYSAGKNKGRAYYGTGAGDTQGQLTGKKYRPAGFDRCEPKEVEMDDDEPMILPPMVGMFGYSSKYEAFTRIGTNCGVKADSSKGFLFRGHRLLCEDFEPSSAFLLQLP